MTTSADWQQMRQSLISPQTVPQKRAEAGKLLLILLAALIHGVIYVFLVPPWQHYDEPNHFEYVWLAEHGLPRTGDFNPRLSYQVLQSMHAHGFYDWLDPKPALPEPADDLRIPGYPQLDDPPAYYLLVGLPGRLLPEMAIEQRLYAARLVSLALLLVTVVAGWGTASALTPPGHPLRLLTPAFLALLPGLVELMSAVNNDAAAIAVLSLFLWAGVRLILHGPRPLELLWVGCAVVACLMAKNTAWIALPLMGVVLVFGFLRGSLQRLAWIGLLVGTVLLLVLAVTFDDPAAWIRAASQTQGLRRADPHAPVGEQVLTLDTGSEIVPGWAAPVVQVLPPAAAGAAFNQPVTLGGWMWADAPVEVRSPILTGGGATFSQTLRLTTAPQFFAFHVDLPPGSDRLWVALDPGDQNGRRVSFDGLVLAVGSYPLGESPVFQNPNGKRGDWGGAPFENLLRNSSFEFPGPRVRAGMDNPAAQRLPDHARPSQALASLWDWSGSGYFYRAVARHLFQTFWARFGWGHVPLAWTWAYILPAAIGLVGLFGCMVGAARRRSELPWTVILLLGLTLLAAWSLTWMRGAVYLSLPGYYYPTARYAYPAVVPVALAVSAGWLSFNGRRRFGSAGLMLLMALLAAVSIYSVAIYYGRI